MAHHHVMKTRDNMRAVIEGLQGDQALLAAYLEATDKIDWRAPKRIAIKPDHTPAARPLSGMVRSTSFVLRRANLEQVPANGR
jgi:hypothetical protein